MNPHQQQQHDTQLARAGFPPHGGPDALWAPTAARRAPLGGGGDDAGQQQPLQKMHRLLRGRYWLAITLSAVCAITLAVAGYLLPKPQYRSDGLIEIKPNIPKLDDTTIVMPLYTQYVESQVSRIMTERVITSAMESEEWRQYSHGLSPAAMKEFVEAMNVEYVRGTFVIRVSFTDRDPSRAQAAVKSLIRAYLVTAGDADTKDLNQRLQYLQAQRDQLARDRRNKQEALLAAAKQYGTQDLGELHDARVKQMIDLETKLAETQTALDNAEAALAANGNANPATQPSGAETEMSYGQIAKVDMRMQSYLMQRDQKIQEADAAARRYGPNHPLVQDSRQQLEDLEARIEAYAQEVRQENTALQVAPDGKTNTAVTPQIVAQLKQQVARLTEHKNTSAELAFAIGNRRVEIQQLQGEIKDIEQKLDDANRLFEQLNVQLAMSGRIDPLSMGDRPHSPAVDNRRKLAALGFLGGSSLPFVVLMLVGLADKRYRYSDETNTDLSGVPLLGILPNLPDLLTDPQQAAVAAHCVHQIRTLLQVGVRTQDRHVYAVTSAAPGDGKTSLTLALGLSFAASGSRTLLIDCDLVGGSLTRRLGVNTPEGMLEAMASRSPLDFVRDTDVADLSILPVGSATMLHAGSFSPAGLRRLIGEARKAFDIVLIDTGPILGSIEAPPVAATADAVILCVSRGQQRPAVERSMHHLLAIGAKLAGLVFNRAEARDFERSVSRFSQRSIRSGDYARGGNGSRRLPGAKAGQDGKGGDAATATAATMDPVTRAVASDFKGEHGNDPR